MTPENFNLQIQTPETGDNDEISKLKSEMMSYKPLIEDAIKRQSLKEAEELFAKAKELKAKLNELRNKEKGIYTVEINGQTLELGPILGMMKWYEIPAKLEELNKTLKPSEKPWRVPTLREYEEIGKPIRKIWDDKKLTTEEKKLKIKGVLERLGFVEDMYWSDTEDISTKSSYAWVAHWVDDVKYYTDNTLFKYSVRCIR
jgi:hypothetical protein